MVNTVNNESVMVNTVNTVSLIVSIEHKVKLMCQYCKRRQFDGRKQRTFDGQYC